jgi:signal transduction histidine kinase
VTLLKRTEESLRETVGKLSVEKALRETFVFALTHDLRTPLTSAKVSAQLLMRESDNPAFIPLVSGRIVRSIDRIDHMIQDLLDANRIRAGEKLPLKPTEFDLAELVRSTLEELSLVHGDRFKVQTESGLVGTWSRDDLQRAIENLVGNAVKYGDRDRPVTVSVKKGSKDQAVLTVQNFGRIIPQDEQATLFEQFRRTAGAEAGDQKGWGIGLTLVRGIAEAHGGAADVESTERDGTTFRLVLPITGPSLAVSCA